MKLITYQLYNFGTYLTFFHIFHSPHIPWISSMSDSLPLITLSKINSLLPSFNPPYIFPTITTINYNKAAEKYITKLKGVEQAKCCFSICGSTRWQKLIAPATLAHLREPYIFSMWWNPITWIHILFLIIEKLAHKNAGPHKQNDLKLQIHIKHHLKYTFRSPYNIHF